MNRQMLIATVAATLSTPVVAQTAPSEQATKSVKDPNRQICQRIEETGSRLGAKRVCMTAAEWAACVCMTAAEWAAQRQADKDLIDRIQSSTYTHSPG